MKKMVPLYLRVSEEVKTELDRLAAETGLSLTATADVVLKRGLGVRWSTESGFMKLVRLLQSDD